MTREDAGSVETQIGDGSMSFLDVGTRDLDVGTKDVGTSPDSSGTAIVPMAEPLGQPPKSDRTKSALSTSAAVPPKDDTECEAASSSPRLESPPWPVLAVTKFPMSSWDPSLRAQVILSEFGASGWEKEVKMPRPPSPENYADEIETLIALQQYRRDRMAEIVVQSQDLRRYWSDILMASPTSRRTTWILVEAALAVGQMVAMKFKFEYMRARPVQVYPALMPPIPTPPHPSYPNAHALQSALIAESVTRACPALEAPLWELARRVRHNREIAGVHFRSDGHASFKIVDSVMNCLSRGCEFKQVLRQAAMCEWQEMPI
jgi:hypothetical protein